jgi:hypothetical protein
MRYDNPNEDTVGKISNAIQKVKCASVYIEDDRLIEDINGKTVLLVAGVEKVESVDRRIGENCLEDCVSHGSENAK